MDNKSYEKYEPDEEMKYEDDDCLFNAMDLSMFGFDNISIKQDTIVDVNEPDCNEYTFDDDFIDDAYEDIQIIHDDKEYDDEIIYLDVDSYSELSAFDRLLYDANPYKYRLSKKPKNKKKDKYKDVRDLSEEEIQEYELKSQRKKDEQRYKNLAKKYKKEGSAKTKKKRDKLERKIQKAYMLEQEKHKCKDLRKLVLNRELQKWKDECGYDYFMGKKGKHYDPYRKYRRSGNIISVSEFEDYVGDFKKSFLKNLEENLMEKLNEPLDIGNKTIVEYYDKKGRLKTSTILEKDNVKVSKKEKKKLKKQHKKDMEKYLSPSYEDIYDDDLPF